jgi:molybdate transport system substrate-binding protein
MAERKGDRWMRRLLWLLVAMALLAAGCGGSSGSSSGSSGGSSAAPSVGTLNVFAAASLTNAFDALGKTYEQQNPGWTVRLNYDGSDILAAQIEQGVPADVYAAASTKYPEQLQGENLLGDTTNFATNTLVLIVPADNPKSITSVNDLTKDNAKLVIGDESVPIGSYTRDVLDGLGINIDDLNIVSQEQKVTDISAKVSLGEADAGFVYVTDAQAAGDKVKSIDLPADANATATYPIGILTDSKNQEAAQRWIDLVMSSDGQQVLQSFGFGPAPSS